MTEEEYQERLSECSKKYAQEYIEALDAFWASHGGRPKGRGDAPGSVTTDIDRRWLEEMATIDHEYELSKKNGGETQDEDTQNGGRCCTPEERCEASFDLFDNLESFHRGAKKQ